MISRHMSWFRRLLLFVFALVVFIHLSISLLKIITTSAPDFSIYFYSTKDLLTHINPYTDKHLYTADNYPILTNLFYIPLTFMPYQIAQAIYIIVSTFCVLISVFFSTKIVQKKISWQTIVLFSALTFLTFPTKFTLGMGQSNLIAYTLLLGSYYLSVVKQKKLVAGIIFALACGLKPILIFVIIFFLMRKYWITVLSSIVTLSVLIFLSGFIFGFQYYYYYIASTFIHVATTGGGMVYYNQGLTGLNARFHFPQILYLIEVIMLIVVLYMQRKSTDIKFFSLILTTLVLIDPLSWQHHFVFLLFPFIYLLLNHPNKKMFGLTILAYVLVAINLKNPEQFKGVAFVLSHGTYGAVLLLYLLIKTNSLRRGYLSQNKEVY